MENCYTRWKSYLLVYLLGKVCTTSEANSFDDHQKS